MISLFGWILAMRGVALMAAPDLYEHAAYVYGRDISCAAHFRGPRRDWTLSHLCGLARQVRLAIRKEQPVSKVMIMAGGVAQNPRTTSTGKSVFAGNFRSYLTQT